MFSNLVALLYKLLNIIESEEVFHPSGCFIENASSDISYENEPGLRSNDKQEVSLETNACTDQQAIDKTFLG